ncbi:Uncharacterized protein Fot_04671 [Forsythia ovata]|uniref:Uncharacterized protein n=1 Tax=Forsythia ovata TaxID=205694 RepID=A0ABD1XD80_9LAMI
MVERIAGQMGPDQIVFHVNCSSTLDIPQSTFNTNTNTINHATGTMLPRCVIRFSSLHLLPQGQRARRDLTNFQHCDICLRCHSCIGGMPGLFRLYGPLSLPTVRSEEPPSTRGTVCRARLDEDA